MTQPRVHRGPPSGDPRHVLSAGAPRFGLPGLAYRGLAALLSPLETETERPLWRDVSVYQGEIDTDVMAANGVHGLIARAAISWGYQDPNFPQNYARAGATGLYRSSYHVIYTDQPVIDQADNWYLAHGEPDPARPVARVIDLQVNRGDPWAHKAEATWEMAEIVRARDGFWPWLYSRYLLINTWLGSWSQEQLNTLFYFLAQYLWDRTREHPGPPTPPDRVDPARILFHQTADKKPGFPGEVESAAVDYTRYQRGSAEEMYAFLASEYGGTQPPAVVPGGEWAAQAHEFLVDRGYGGPPPDPEVY